MDNVLGLLVGWFIISGIRMGQVDHVYLDFGYGPMTHSPIFDLH